MRRLLLFGILTAGCETFSPFVADETKPTVLASQLDPAAHAAAERLDRVGRQITFTNPFLASRPAFGFVGSVVPERYHTNADAVFVSRGLIDRCRTDDELAAFVCLELAEIATESGHLSRLGLATPTVGPPETGESADPDVADLAGAETVGKAGPASTVVRTMESRSIDTLAKEYHRNAGYRAEAFEKIKKLIPRIEPTDGTAKQMAGSKSKPTWTP